jgi:hypothetical protein
MLGAGARAPADGAAHRPQNHDDSARGSTLV